ncbi:MAG: hypothetical protein IKE29_00205 [Paenibacillus sp.]|uniref:hypothetical protein n=1 Tax=Paenibacillus sp. TaxID=58172 RepID=UPI0025E752A4|nr:hypothetical protein [Paenibacillus sp.]MBR2563029.1 hypothetical protein [Paenibacillus sp.]
MLDELEIKIKERIQERYNILGELYSNWFTENTSILAPKNVFYQTEHIEKHRAISYLLDKGYIIAQLVDGEDEMVAVHITLEGIDTYEQGYLTGEAKGFQVVADIKDKN